MAAYREHITVSGFLGVAYGAGAVFGLGFSVTTATITIARTPSWVSWTTTRWIASKGGCWITIDLTHAVALVVLSLTRLGISIIPGRGCVLGLIRPTVYEATPRCATGLGFGVTTATIARTPSWVSRTTTRWIASKGS